jgi:serine/threonine protein kinase
MAHDDKTYEWNNYIITRPAIGKGSYSKVYHGYHKHTKQEIALKKILFSSLENVSKDKIISEIAILQKMDHEHIMKLYDYKFDGDYIMLVTEYCNQGDLHKWMSTSHTAEEMLSIMSQITNGMSYLHQNHILHRDIKTQNILLHDGRIKICDFGFSTTIKDYLQMCSTMCGTPLFMSPELICNKPYTISADIWSLGIIFYMMMYNRHPFGVLQSLNDYRTKIRLSYIIPFPPHELDIIPLVKQMLSYIPEERPTITTIVQRITHRGTITSEFTEFTEFTEFIDVTEFPFEIEEEEDTENKDKEEEEKDKEDENRPSSIHKQRINELEEHIFKLETILKETKVKKERSISSVACCFTLEEDDSIAVTGRGRTNKGYELQINTEYFTPPNDTENTRNTGTKPMLIPTKKTPGSQPSSQSSSGTSVGSKNKSFLSTSFEKLASFFTGLTPK